MEVPMEIEPHLLPLLNRLFYPQNIRKTIESLRIDTIEEGVAGESSSEANLESIILGGADFETDA